MCASCDNSALLQVWHRRDPAGFECTYSLEIEIERYQNPLLASDGSVVAIVPQSSSAKSHAWNRDTARFHPVDLDYQVYIRGCENSSDGKLFTCWSSHPSLGFTNWPTCLQVFSVLGGWNCPLTYTDSTSSWCQTHRSLVKKRTKMQYVYTGRLYAQILGRTCTHMAFNEVDQSWCVI